MVRTPGYEELQATGKALRVRLANAGSSAEAVAAVVNEIRVWQRRCAWVVVARTPRAMVDFRVATGSFQRPMGTWNPTPDWQRRLDDSLLTWLSALDRVKQRSGRANEPARGYRHRERAGSRF
jgi:hypothetical protein